MRVPQKRIFIDSNVWNYLFSNKVDLSVEFPSSDFSLYIAGEQELENSAIPDKINEKKALKDFIYSSIKKWGVKTDKYFGFYDDRHPANEQRVGGFDEGRWATKKELKFIESQRERLGDSKKKSGLYKNEADIALAARSSNSIVLTNDEKTGPLRTAKNLGWDVFFLNEFNPKNGSLLEFISPNC